MTTKPYVSSQELWGLRVGQLMWQLSEFCAFNGIKEKVDVDAMKGALPDGSF